MLSRYTAGMRFTIDWLLDKGMEDPRGMTAFAKSLDLAAPAEVLCHTHPFNELIYLVAGEGVQVCGTRYHRFLPGDLFFFPAGDWHIAYRILPASAIVVNFYDAAFAPGCPGDHDAILVVRALHARAQEQRHHIPVPAALQPRVDELLTTLVEEATTNRPGAAAMMKSQLQCLLVLLWRETEVGPAVEADWSWDAVVASAAAIEPALAYIAAHLHEPMRAALVAEIAGMSRSSFFTAFKRYTGVTLVQYVNRLRVMQAAKLLETSDGAVPLIGQQVGFTCTSHFFATFKLITGQSPQSYRTLRHRR
jgi:AraC-like DNA-binding protein